MMKHVDEDIQKFYNDIARQFADEWYANESLLPVLKEFLALLDPNPRVLDLGCGAGYESMRLYRLGAEVVGIDYSAEPVQIALERNPQCRFEVMDFRLLDDSLGYFDGIVAAASIIHIPDEELSIVFRNMKKVIKAEGYLMLLVVEGQGINIARSQIERNGVKYNRPFYLHSKTRLNEVAEDTGFLYYNELKLNDELDSFGWKCFLYKSK